MLYQHGAVVAMLYSVLLQECYHISTFWYLEQKIVVYACSKLMLFMGYSEFKDVRVVEDFNNIIGRNELK